VFEIVEIPVKTQTSLFYFVDLKSIVPMRKNNTDIVFHGIDFVTNIDENEELYNLYVTKKAQCNGLITVNTKNSLSQIQ